MELAGAALIGALTSMTGCAEFGQWMYIAPWHVIMVLT